MTISSLLRIHPRFMRSVHLERDIKDPTSSRGYILTPVAQQALDRITAGVRRQSTQRAWRVAGDYGSGKTDFALILARVVRGFKNELPKDLHRFVQNSTFLPMMATGDSEPLGVTVLRALGIKWKGTPNHPTPNEILRAIRESVAKAKKQSHVGIILILDELGKNLEYAARNPESDDIFLLQQLAEEADRSGDNAFAIVVMLHQGIAAYSSNLDSAAKREWDKVSGRFQEIIYAQPIEQVAALAGATLNTDLNRLPDAIKKESSLLMGGALKMGLYGSSAPQSLSELGSKLFPLHPAAFPIIVRTMRRFGQNERSLFSFISSSEPMSLQAHARAQLEIGSHYRIHHFFDYARLNLLPSMAIGHSHTHWGVIESVLASTPVETPEEEAVLKTVAMLCLLDAPDLPATENVVALSVGGERKAVDKAIRKLRDLGVIYERGAVKGLYLWPHTSVNLDELFAKAVQITSENADGVRLLCEYIHSEHLVPREYYARTGTLRYAEVKLLPASRLTEFLADQPQLTGEGSDLNVRVLIPANKVEQTSTKRILREKVSELTEGLYVAVAEPPTQAIAALTDLVAWDWVKKNTGQLSGDRYAREEVSRQLSQAERILRTRIGGLQNLAIPTGQYVEWHYKRSKDPSRLMTGRHFTTFLGEECRRIYCESPKVLNELINRRAPSGAAVAARTKLVEAMTTSSEKAYLGMDATKRPAEMALYLSILENGGFHVPAEEGYVFRVPTNKQDKCNLVPSLRHITATLKSRGIDELVSVPDIFHALSLPPYGVRDGLRPFILAIYLATHHQRVALYEDGTYLHEVGGNAFLRLMKEPQFFHLQYCEVDGVRADVFKKLLQLLKISPRDAVATDIIDLVRPLTVFIAQEVPEYCRKTNHLSAAAVAVRRVLLDAKQPIKLVFTMLPEACGLPPIGKDGLKSPEELAARLQKAIHEIRTAYPNLVDRLRNSIYAAFDVNVRLTNARSIIADRAAQLAVTITEPALKAFALRLADNKLEDRGWVESVANLLARKSPERWIESDETEYHHQLEIAASRFKRTELTLIGTTKRLNGHAARIAITKSDGSEVGDLVNWDGMDENSIRSVQVEIQQLLTKHGRYGLAAAMRAIWTQLETGEKKEKS